MDRGREKQTIDGRRERFPIIGRLRPVSSSHFGMRRVDARALDPKMLRSSVERCAARLCTGIALLLIASGVLGAERADAQARPVRRTGRLTLSSGFDFSTGDYGSSGTTQIAYAPFSVKYARDPFVVKLTIPYIRITGPGNVVGVDGVLVSGGSAKRETNDGLGDVILSTGYVLAPLRPAWPYLEFTGKVKFPTASEKRNLGTGEFDGTLQVEASKTFAAFTPFLTTGYRFVGNPPGNNLHNVLFCSLGFDYRVNARLDAGLTYEWRQTASPSVGDSQELSPYLSWKITSHVSLTPYAVFGLTRAATDAEIGFGASYRF